MRRFGKILGRLIIVGLVLAAVFYIAPRETIARSGPIAADLSDPEAVLAAREAAFDDITEGTHAQIVWTGVDGARSDWVVVYLHGFSATHHEIQPVPENVAAALDANLILTRLSGHGRGGDAMAEPRAGDWVDDAALAMALARQIGERVLVIGVSTGATLAIHGAAQPDIAEGLEALVLISPNFRTANPLGALLEMPFARHWVPLVGGETRTFAAQSEDHGRYWTTSYPTVATVTMGTLLREVRALDAGALELPVLAIFSDGDQVVSAEVTRSFLSGWGGPVTLAEQDLPSDGTDVFEHVIAGDILSPAMTDSVTAQITDWAITTLP